MGGRTRRASAVGAACVAAASACACGGSGTPTPTDRVPRGAASDQRPEPRVPHRPLRLPRRADRCPRSTGGRAAPEAGITVGRGPVYPVLGFASRPPAPGGVIDVREQARRTRHGLELKVLWAVRPRFAGPVRIRGARIGGAGRMRFDRPHGGSPRLELRLPPQSGSDSWAYHPSTMYLPRPGCYALQLEGERFVRRVVFEAVG